MTENYQMTAKELQHKRDRLSVAQQDLDKTEEKSLLLMKRNSVRL